MIQTVSLKKNYEFMKVYKKGKFYVGKFMILYVLTNHMNSNRLGITANKKVGKSVQRNRFRRLIKENYRLYEPFIKKSFDFVVVARNSGGMPEYNEIRKELRFLLKRLRVFDQEKWNCLKET